MPGGSQPAVGLRSLRPGQPAAAADSHLAAPPAPRSGGTSALVRSTYAVLAGVVGVLVAALGGARAPRSSCAAVLATWASGLSFHLLFTEWATLQLWPTVGASSGVACAIGLLAVALPAAALATTCAAAGFTASGLVLRVAAPALRGSLRPAIVGAAAGVCGGSAALLLARRFRRRVLPTAPRALQLVCSAVAGSYGLTFCVDHWCARPEP